VIRSFLITGRTFTPPSGRGSQACDAFVQSRRLSIPGDKTPGDFDGMVELWFDNVEALLSARRSQEWQASTADEQNFIDYSKVAYFVSEEHIIF
jgi:EthD domain